MAPGAWRLGASYTLGGACGASHPPLGGAVERPTPWAALWGVPPPGRRCGASHTPWAALWSALHPGRRCGTSHTLGGAVGRPAPWRRCWASHMGDAQERHAPRATPSYWGVPLAGRASLGATGGSEQRPQRRFSPFLRNKI